MKIKEICTKTGLTEKAVRYYVESGLCAPQEYESRGRKYLNFTDDNLAELKDIVVMRKLGFSIEDIRMMQTNGNSIEDVMDRYIRSLSEELEIKNRIFSSLSDKDYSDMQSLDQLMPTLTDVLRPDPADPDFSKFESGVFDDGRDGELYGSANRPGRFVRLQEVFITYSAVIGTLMAITTLPGIILFIIAAFICRRVRADYVTLYEVLSGVGFLANAIAFVRSVASVGGIVQLSEALSSNVLRFAAVQCGLYLVAAAAGLVSLMILFFGQDIKEQF